MYKSVSRFLNRDRLSDQMQKPMVRCPICGCVLLVTRMKKHLRFHGVPSPRQCAAGKDFEETATAKKACERSETISDGPLGIHRTDKTGTGNKQGADFQPLKRQGHSFLPYTTLQKRLTAGHGVLGKQATNCPICRSKLTVRQLQTHLKAAAESGDLFDSSVRDLRKLWTLRDGLGQVSVTNCPVCRKTVSVADLRVRGREIEKLGISSHSCASLNRLIAEVRLLILANSRCPVCGIKLSGRELGIHMREVHHEDEKGNRIG